MTLWEKFGDYRADEPFLPWAYRVRPFQGARPQEEEPAAADTARR